MRTLLTALVLAAGCVAAPPDAEDAPVETFGREPFVRPLVGELPRTFPATRSVRVLLLGHLYGDPELRDEASPGPSATFLARTAELAELRPDLVLTLGDTFWLFEPPFVEPVLEALAELRAPVINAVGNHDLTRPWDYVERFGWTYGAVRLGPVLLCVLDGESLHGRVGDEQREFLLRAARRAAREEVPHLVVATHRLLWAAGPPELAPVHRHVNARLEEEPDFQDVLAEVLAVLPERTRVTCVAGDVGAWFSRPLVHHVDARGVRYVAVGLGELPRDCALLATLGADGGSGWEVVPLGPDAPRSLAEGSPERWQEAFGDE